MTAHTNCERKTGMWEVNRCFRASFRIQSIAEVFDAIHYQRLMGRNPGIKSLNGVTDNFMSFMGGYQGEDIWRFRSVILISHGWAEHRNINLTFKARSLGISGICVGPPRVKRHKKLMVEGRIRNMDFFGRNSNNGTCSWMRVRQSGSLVLCRRVLTIFCMHVMDLPIVLPRLDPFIIKLIPESNLRPEGPRKASDGTEE